MRVRVKRWLKRALNMMRQLLQNITDGEREVKKAANDAYAATLKKHHGFMVKVWMCCH